MNQDGTDASKGLDGDRNVKQKKDHREESMAFDRARNARGEEVLMTVVKLAFNVPEETRNFKMIHGVS